MHLNTPVTVDELHRAPTLVSQEYAKRINLHDGLVRALDGMVNAFPTYFGPKIEAARALLAPFWSGCKTVDMRIDLVDGTRAPWNYQLYYECRL